MREQIVITIMTIITIGVGLIMFDIGILVGNKCATGEIEKLTDDLEKMLAELKIKIREQEEKTREKHSV